MAYLKCFLPPRHPSLRLSSDIPLLCDENAFWETQFMCWFMVHGPGSCPAGVCSAVNWCAGPYWVLLVALNWSLLVLDAPLSGSFPGSTMVAYSCTGPQLTHVRIPV